MNEQPSYYNLAFSYLLLFAITGILVARIGSGGIQTRDLADTDKQSMADSIAIINAEARLPIYAARNKHSNANDPAAELPLDPATTDPVISRRPATELHGDRDIWHINIASLTDRDEADRIVQHARIIGIDATQAYVVVDGKRYWRVYAKFGLSLHEAHSYATQVKQRLGLNEVWISKAAD